MKRNKLPSQKFLKSVLKYDENSPSGLIWINDRNMIRYSQKAGAISKSKNNSGFYWRICINRVFYRNHNIIWKLIYNEDIEDGYVIDHIDNNGLNNNILNLRKITWSNNSKHAKNCKLNSTGYVGIKLKINNTYEAFFAYESKQYSKMFYNFLDALEYRLENVLRYYGLYNNYELDNIKSKHPELFERIWNKVFGE